PSSPLPLAGEGGERRRREPGEGLFLVRPLSPPLRGDPLPIGERGKKGKRGGCRVTSASGSGPDTCAVPALRPSPRARRPGRRRCAWCACAHTHRRGGSPG